MNQLPASLDEFDEGIVQADHLARLDPRHPQVSGLLLFGLSQRAAVQARLGKSRQADADWDRVLSIAPPAQHNGVRLQRADSRARAGDYQRSGTEATDLARDCRDGPTLYSLACIQALNSASTSRDLSRPLPEREKLTQQYARQALALLKRSASAGFFHDPEKVAHLDRDSDLACLRDRADYKQFRAGLERAP
jgi:hypothetical protein